MKNITLLFITVALAVVHVSFRAQCTAASVPYYQGFSEITSNNQLPACWAASNLGSTCLTFTSASAFAAFNYSPSNTSYFYTEPIQFYTGITYSVSLWKKISTPGQNWVDLSLHLGSSQSSTGLVPILSSGGPVTNTLYTIMGGTFTVPSTGVKHLAVSGTGYSYNAPFLEWDDLEITTPCSQNPITVSIITSSPSPICKGDTLVLWAGPAPYCSYFWSNGSTLPTATVSPTVPTTYSLTILNTVTNCSTTVTKYVNLHPEPIVSVFADPSIVCLGDSTKVTGYGAQNYRWSTADTTQMIYFTPTTNTTVTVWGVNNFGCWASATASIAVTPPPNVLLSASKDTICIGESVLLTASGAQTYTWSNNSNGSTNLVQPTFIATVFQVQGADSNNCVRTVTIQIKVDECLPLEEKSFHSESIRVFPNPFNTVLNCEFENETCWSVRLITFDGKVVAEYEGSRLTLQINTESLSKGVYYLRTSKDQELRYYKLLKN